MVDRIALVERNDIELARYQSRAQGGAFGQEPDATWFALDIPAGRFNCILSARLAETKADERIEELLAPYRSRSRGRSKTPRKNPGRSCAWNRSWGSPRRSHGPCSSAC